MGVIRDFVLCLLFGVIVAVVLSICDRYEQMHPAYPEPVVREYFGQAYLLEYDGDTQPVFVFDKRYGGVVPMPCPDKEREGE